MKYLLLMLLMAQCLGELQLKLTNQDNEMMYEGPLPDKFVDPLWNEGENTIGPGLQAFLRAKLQVQRIDDDPRKVTTASGFRRRERNVETRDITRRVNFVIKSITDSVIEIVAMDAQDTVPPYTSTPDTIGVDAMPLPTPAPLSSFPGKETIPTILEGEQLKSEVPQKISIDNLKMTLVRVLIRTSIKLVGGKLHQFANIMRLPQAYMPTDWPCPHHALYARSAGTLESMPEQIKLQLKQLLNKLFDKINIVSVIYMPGQLDIIINGISDTLYELNTSDGIEDAVKIAVRPSSLTVLDHADRPEFQININDIESHILGINSLIWIGSNVRESFFSRAELNGIFTGISEDYELRNLYNHGSKITCALYKNNEFIQQIEIKRSVVFSNIPTTISFQQFMLGLLDGRFIQP